LKSRSRGKDGVEMGLQKFMKSAHGAASVPELWSVVQAFARTRDIRMVSYHSIEVKSLGKTSFDIVEFGVPESFKRRYLEERLYLDDPFPGIAAERIEPFYWSDAPKLAHFTPGQHLYLDVLKEEGISNGIALQVFGPQARNALVGIGFFPDTPRLSDDGIFELQQASQCAHLRFCALTEGERPAYPKLSPRELEVLRWIAKGKSNSVIAEIMGVSRHTVDTITRRVFDKLRVTDRTRAVVRAIGGGLLSHSGDDLL